jgi:carboxypeptidase family protein
LNTPSIRRQELIKEEKQYKEGASGEVIFGIAFGIVIVILTVFIAVEKTLYNNTNSDDNIGLIELNPAKETITATSSPTTAADMAVVNGLVTSQTGLPVKGASVVAYKQMGLIYSVEKSGGYSVKSFTPSSGHYSFDGLPSGIYKFTVTYPDGKTQVLPNYAVWPGSVSEHSFQYSTDYMYK